MKLPAKLALYSIALLIGLFIPALALATDTNTSTAVLPDGDAARTINDPRYPDAAKLPTDPQSETKPPAVDLDGAQDNNSEPQEQPARKKSTTSTTESRRSETAGISATTTTTEKKKVDAEPTSKVEAVDKPAAQEEPEAKTPVVVKGAKVENPATNEKATKKPFEFGIDIKPYLAAFILFGLFVTTGNKRYAPTTLGGRETVARRRTSLR